MAWPLTGDPLGFLPSASSVGGTTAFLPQNFRSTNFLPTSGAVVSGGFPYDFTTKAGIAASLVAPTRTGVTVYPQITPNTDPAGATVEAIGNDTAIWENRGPGLAGLAVFDSYANDIPDIADFSLATGGWTVSGAITYTADVGASPLAGANNADRLTDNSTSAARAIFRPSTSSRTAKKLFVKDVPSDPATSPGELCHSSSGGDGGAGGRTIFPTATQWQVIRHMVRISNSAFAIFPAGDGSSGAGRVPTGSMDFWGAQMVINGWFDLPLAAGGGSSTGMCVCPVRSADLASIVSGGEVDIEVTFAPYSNDEGYAAAAAYLWRFDTPAGELSLRTSGTTFNLLTLRVGGVDVATTSVTGTDNTCGWSWDQELAVRVRITATSARIRSRVNCGTVVDKIVTGLSLTLNTPTAGWIGSNGTTAGSSFNALIKRFETFTDHSAMSTTTGPAATLVVLGDSIMSFRGSANEPAPAVLMGSIAEAAAGKRVVTLATPSDTIEGQSAKFSASQYASAGTTAVIICVGINNIIAGDSVATLCTKYQSLINTIRAACATAKIIVYQLLPADANPSMDATREQVWVDFNSCLAGVAAGGGSAITGYDRYNTACSNALNTNGSIGAAGVNNLVSPNAAGIHPMLDGRQLIANNFVSDLQFFSLW